MRPLAGESVGHLKHEREAELPRRDHENDNGPKYRARCQVGDSLFCYAAEAGTNPSQPLMGVTFRCRAAFFGCPHSSMILRSALWLLTIRTRTSVLCCSPK